MKNIISYTLIFFMLIIGGCNDFLDYNEQDFYEEDDIFSVFSRTESSVNNLYGKLPGGIHTLGGSTRASATDDAVEANDADVVHIMNDGRWSSIRTIDENWAVMYQAIRSANRILDNYDVGVLQKYRFNDEYLQWLSEYETYDLQTRLLRAFFYYELIKRYGDVPLLNGKILLLDEVNEVERTSFELVKNFIVDECNSLIDELPLNWDDFSGDQTGRVTSGVAMALKARVLLLAASPLHNPENSQVKWIAAAQASWDIIDSGLYSLEDNYKNVVNNSQSNELIFGERLSRSNWFEEDNFPVGFVGAEPGTCPSQNIVDTYKMANGLDIDDMDSGYDPDNPYENRDPRLKQTIIVNNSIWKDRNVEIWNGGNDGQPKQYATPTGYYLKKYVVESVNLDPAFTTTATHLAVTFRYGEVLLNYAEAMNEAYGPLSMEEFGMTAYEAVNMIRNRAGMPNFADGMTADEFRQELRDERRVELAFEGHRFWDIRRWKIGEQTTIINGMEITRNENDGTFNYEVVTVENRLWENKKYLYPIPQDELFKNDNLDQNPDW